MPLCCDPNQFVTIFLDTDLATPVKRRPAFNVRFMSSREERRFVALLKASVAEKDADTEMKLFQSALAVAFVGWENVADRDGKPVEFKLTDSATNLDAVMSPADLWELASKVLPMLSTVQRGIRQMAANAAAARAAQAKRAVVKEQQGE